MKFSITAFLIFSCFMLQAQSPGLGINLWMDPVKAGPVHYKIEMKICEPRKRSDRGDLFTHDTSTIDFASLLPTDINCDIYVNDGMPEIISGNEEAVFNHFKFSNQVFAWENIFIFRIADLSSRSRKPEMYIIIPMKYKSFVTTIDIKNVVYQPGKVIFLKDIKGTYDRSKLSFSRSLIKIKGVEVKAFSLKGIL